MQIEDLKKIKPKRMPYNFVLFYDVPMDKLKVNLMFNPSEPGDNAMLTYCFIDEMAGMSFDYICCARKYVNGDIELRDRATKVAMTYREGAVEAEYEIVSKDLMIGDRTLAEIEPEVKEYRGCEPERLVIHEDQIFDEYKHPWYTNDIYACLVNNEIGRVEAVWVTEAERYDDYVIGRLVNQPSWDVFGVNQGDTVRIIPYVDDDGEVIPIIDPHYISGNTDVYEAIWDEDDDDSFLSLFEREGGR